MAETVVDILIRPCFEHDLDQVSLIYGHHVMTGTGTFELEPPSIDEMRARWRKIVAAGWPYLVATWGADSSRIVAFSYAQQWRDRAAYAHTVEDTIYVAPGMENRKIGYFLLGALLRELADTPARQVVAVIGDGGNAASRALHARHGFKDAGVLTSVGYKFGRWLDVVFMQRGLDPAEFAEAPEITADR